MSSGEERNEQVSADYIQSEGRCLLCNLNTCKRGLQAQFHQQLSGPCQQCQNHSLEHVIQALRRSNSNNSFLFFE